MLSPRKEKYISKKCKKKKEKKKHKLAVPTSLHRGRSKSLERQIEHSYSASVPVIQVELPYTQKSTSQRRTTHQRNQSAATSSMLQFYNENNNSNYITDEHSSLRTKQQPEGKRKGNEEKKLEITPQMREAIGRMKKASTWNAETLECSGLKMTFLPKGLFRIVSLKVLVLGNNCLTEISPSLSRLVNLKTLELQHNNFRTFPEAVFLLPKLKTLKIYHNHLVTIPEKITTLNKLAFLHVFGNKELKYPPYNLVGRDKVANNKEVVFGYLTTHSYAKFLKQRRKEKHERKRSASKSPRGEEREENTTNTNGTIVDGGESPLRIPPSLSPNISPRTRISFGLLQRVEGSKDLTELVNVHSL